MTRTDTDTPDRPPALAHYIVRVVVVVALAQTHSPPLPLVVV